LQLLRSRSAACSRPAQQGTRCRLCAARAVNVCATFLVIYAVDRWGRRKVLIGGAVHMLITQVVIAGLLGRFYSAHMPVDVSIVVVVFVCLFVSGHAWSWGARGAPGRAPAMRAAMLPSCTAAQLPSVK
jgi:hypothetical protein